MMHTLIFQGLQIFLSMLEVWLCYQLLYCTVLEKEYLNLKEKIIIWVNIIVWGISVSYNRSVIFFSHNVFICGLIFTSICAICIVKKDKLLVVGLIATCYSLIALLDFLFMFLSAVFLDRFVILEIYHGNSYYKIPIFLLARVVIAVGLFWLAKKGTIFLNNIYEYRKMLYGTGIIFVAILRKYQLTTFQMVFGKIPYNGMDNGLSLLSLLLIIICVTALYVKSLILQKENQFLLSRDELMHQNYGKLRALVESNRQISHDIKNYFMVLQEYDKSGKYKEIHEYLEKINGKLGALDEQVWTGHRILDFVLNQKRKVAEQKGIDFEICASALMNLTLSDEDISVLFGNLLDNAIEACEQIQDGRRWILFKLQKRQQLLFIEITNSMGNAPIIKNGVILTSKKNKKLHGYGLKSVKRIVEKCNGTFSFSMEEGVFKVNLSFFEIENGF